MRLGLYLDLRRALKSERSWPDHYARWLEICEEADAGGASSVWLTEHHFFDDGYLPQPLTFAAAIASRTRRLRIGVAVLLLPLHDAIEVAEQAAVVDVLSGGRVDLGLGVGYRKPEYIAFGGDFRGRYATFESRVLELRSHWGERGAAPVVTPGTIQRPMPLWCGFTGPRGARLAGRLGAGLLTLERRLLAPYEAGLAEGDGGSARMAGLVEVLVSDDPERAWLLARDGVAERWNSYNRSMFEGTSQTGPPDVDPDELRSRGMISVGTPEEIAAVIKGRTDGLPVEEVFCWGDFPGAPESVVDDHVRLLNERVAPLLASPEHFDGGVLDAVQ